jgi:hypothetical protein
MIDIDIAELVSWALVDQKAAYFCELPRENTKALMSSTAIVTGTLALGVQVDCQPGFLKRMGARCHPDAVTVWEGLEWLGREEPDTRLLLIRFGRARSYPDWTIWPELKPKRHPGNNKVVVETEYDDAGTVVAQWCPLEGYPSLELVQETRLTYCRWHGGLVRLKARISKRLASYRVTGPKMPAYPWAVENPT